MPYFDTPVVPHTPSSTINSMLEKRCGKKNNMIMDALAYYICGFYHVVNTFYNAINMDPSRNSYRLWITACSIIGFLIVLKAYLLYSIIIASAFIVHILLYYGATALGLFGIGLAVSGVMFFDKDAGKTKRPPIPTKPVPTRTFPAGAKVVPDMVRGIENPISPKPTTAPEPLVTAPEKPEIPSEPKPNEEKKLD